MQFGVRATLSDDEELLLLCSIFLTSHVHCSHIRWVLKNKWISLIKSFEILPHWLMLVLKMSQSLGYTHIHTYTHTSTLTQIDLKNTCVHPGAILTSESPPNCNNTPMNHYDIQKQSVHRCVRVWVSVPVCACICSVCCELCVCHILRINHKRVWQGFRGNCKSRVKRNQPTR